MPSLSFIDLQAAPRPDGRGVELRMRLGTRDISGEWPEKLGRRR